MAATKKKDLVPGKYSSHIWERCKGESEKAFEGFRTYRDMGASRSLARVGKKLGKSSTLVERWSSLWSWRDRIAAYEAYVERQREQARLDHIRDMERRHATYARWLQAKGADRIRSADADALSLAEARRFLETGVKTEREAYGVRPNTSSVDRVVEMTGILDSAETGQRRTPVLHVSEDELDVVTANLLLSLQARSVQAAPSAEELRQEVFEDEEPTED